jgi:myosin heavy subunit
MENGTFQNLHLSHLDFLPSSSEEARAPDMTSSVPSPKGSSSFQTLLTQNEDLVARLRVTLQRLSLVEQQNQNLHENFDAVRSQNSAVLDQLLIWKEKEKIWKEKELNFERLRHDENREITIEMDLLRQKTSQLDKAQEELERYRKYHEKIRTSVKPYIQKLKGYTQSLFAQTQDLNTALLEKERLLVEAETKLHAAQEEARRKAEVSQMQMNELVSVFEEERDSLRAEIRHYVESQEIYQEKTRSLERSLERQDELENLIIALRRTKEESHQQQQVEMLQLKQSHTQQQQDFKTLQLQAEDLKKTLDDRQSQLKKVEEAHTDTLEQLTSLRYLWNQKSEENEKLKLSLQGLEKLNLELSQKLKTLRELD